MSDNLIQNFKVSDDLIKMRCIPEGSYLVDPYTHQTIIIILSSPVPKPLAQKSNQVPISSKIQ